MGGESLGVGSAELDTHDGESRRVEARVFERTWYGSARWRRCVRQFEALCWCHRFNSRSRPRMVRPDRTRGSQRARAHFSLLPALSNALSAISDRLMPHGPEDFGVRGAQRVAGPMVFVAPAYRRPKPTLRRSLTGAFIGAAILGLADWAYVSHTCQNDCGAAVTLPPFLAVPVGFALGTVAAALTDGGGS